MASLLKRAHHTFFLPTGLHRRNAGGVNSTRYPGTDLCSRLHEYGVNYSNGDVTTMLKRSALLALMLLPGCLPATERDFQMAQTVTEMVDAVNEIRQLVYELQDRVDSLTLAVAKRDTVVRQLANLAGVSYPQ